jgi:hypothetical protein
MPRVPAALLVALGAACALRTARAQQGTTIVLAPYTPPAPASVLAVGGASDQAALAPAAASLPFRLALISSVYALGPAFGVGGCSEASVAAAGTILPTQPYTQIQLTPRLVLHGFSDLGCPGDPYAPIDAGAGGGLTYAAPLRSDAWLVGSAGGFGVPGHLGLPPRASAQGGLDLVVQQKSKAIWSAGLGVTATGRGARIIPRVGGSF